MILLNCKLFDIIAKLIHDVEKLWEGEVVERSFWQRDCVRKIVIWL